MMRAFRSEWSRLMRPGILMGAAGTMVLSAVLVTAILFAIAKPAADVTRDDLLSGRGTVTRENLEAGNGMVLAFGLTGQLLGIVALVLFAQNLGAEYNNGTLKVLLVREPRRLRLLAGKATALALLTTLAILVAFLLQAVVAVGLAVARDYTITAWFQQGSLKDAGLLLLRVIVAALAWGLIGFLLAILLRASAPAVGIGIGYTVVAESLLSLAFNKGAKYLPGRTLQSFVTWGAPAQPGQPVGLSGPASTALLLAYGAVMLTTALVLFKRRDVAG